MDKDNYDIINAVIFMDLKAMVALVTGSSKGLGASIIEKLASRGCNVVINYLNSEEEAKKLQLKVVSLYNVEALIIKADVSKEEDVLYMVETIIKHFGKIDILVNNAGIAMDNDFMEKTADEFSKVINVNLLGTFLMSKYVGKHMLENRCGKIINISSTNGIDTNYPLAMDYDASKAGIISLTHNYAKALAPYVNVNAIAPGWINTEPVMQMEESFRLQEQEKILFKRFAEPMEIAKVVAFLASSDASYVNNAVIRVDGGY